jgi:Uri superfamily endonuclease
MLIVYIYTKPSRIHFVSCYVFQYYLIMQATYTLLIELAHPTVITIGRRGDYSFEAGWYAYVGSALNGLEHRIARHLRREKKLHWHIDYLLEHAVVRGVIYAETDKKHECRVAQALLKTLEPVPGFGCTDCRCLTHLFHHANHEQIKAAVLNSFRDLKLTPSEIAY